MIAITQTYSLIYDTNHIQTPENNVYLPLSHDPPIFILMFILTKVILYYILLK